MLDAIECVDAVVGVSGKQYITNVAVANNPAVKDIGYDSNLNYEALVLLQPDVVLMYGVSAANDSVTAKLRDLGIPYLYLGDYTEESPLGKAEWVVAVAEIVGCRKRGEEVFSQIAQRYNEVRGSVVRSDDAPKVMFNLPYQDVWYMPSDDSYMVQLVEDAGGRYIYKGKNPSGGSKGISLEEAYMLVSDTDIWLNAGQCSTMEELRSSAPHFADAPVVLAGEVYNNNRRRTEAGGSDFWESAIVRPDVVLSDLVTIIAGGDDETFYYQKLQ
jgi:iron complex transport system substrate-binding protein